MIRHDHGDITKMDISNKYHKHRAHSFLARGQGVKAKAKASSLRGQGQTFSWPRPWFFVLKVKDSHQGLHPCEKLDQHTSPDFSEVARSQQFFLLQRVAAHLIQVLHRVRQFVPGRLNLRASLRQSVAQTVRHSCATSDGKLGRKTLGFVG